MRTSSVGMKQLRSLENAQGLFLDRCREAISPFCLESPFPWTLLSWQGLGHIDGHFDRFTTALVFPLESGPACGSSKSVFARVGVPSSPVASGSAAFEDFAACIGWFWRLGLRHYSGASA